MRSQGEPRTPNTGTLNSQEMHYIHNTSASSGSHTLEMNTTRDTMDGLPHRIEQAEVGITNTPSYLVRRILQV